MQLLFSPAVPDGGIILKRGCKCCPHLQKKAWQQELDTAKDTLKQARKLTGCLTSTASILMFSFVPSGRGKQLLAKLKSSIALRFTGTFKGAETPFLNSLPAWSYHRLLRLFATQQNSSSQALSELGTGH